MRSDLVLLAAGIAIVSALPYIIDTVKGKTHPNIVTWVTWTVINGVNAAAAWSSGATQTAIFSTTGALATFAIVLVGLKSGLRHYGRFDITCQAAALGGVCLWRLTHNPSLAVLVSLGADFAGFLPTYRHALHAPGAETWQAFALSASSAALTIVSIQHYTFIALASPVYILGANTLIVTTIVLLRRRAATEPQMVRLSE